MSHRRDLPLAVVSLLLTALAGRAGAQQTVRAPGGVLSGIVEDSATGAPVAYALIVGPGKDQRVFASGSGRFALTGLSAGKATIRVQQIGYRAEAVALDVALDPAAAGGAALVIRLARRPFALPEIVVHGDVCSGAEQQGLSAEEDAIIDEAIKNAERLLALEKSYPYRGVFESVAVVFDSTQNPVLRRTDTVRYDSRTQRGYHRGEVLEGPRGPRQVANYFTTSDLAREEFRKHHCFWYGGRDTANDGLPAHRIEFAPLASVKSADWAGSLLIDSATSVLRRSDAHLVNLIRKQTTFATAECKVLYQEMVPTLVLENRADCTSSRSEGRPLTMERWRLILFRFVGKSPVPDLPPPG